MDLAVLERALKREQARRQKAEQLLESKARELYLSYQTLQESHAQLGAAHEEVKRQQKQLVQSEKLASLGTMAAGVAHEINNPLGYVSSNVHSLTHTAEQFVRYDECVRAVILAGSAAERSDAIARLCEFIKDGDIEYLLGDFGELLDETLEGIERVKSIVADLRTFARGDAEEAERVDVIECLRSTIKIAASQAPFTLRIIEDYDELPLIRGYPGRLCQVFLNLLVNASQAMADEGHITITARQTADAVVLSFQDTGCGMTQETAKDIFTPFFTTKPVGEGTGLGLSISHGIIEDHAGTISVTSDLGVGTCFTITLPKDENAVAA